MLEVLLRTHRDPDDIDFARLWEDGLFIFDSNVLLDLYRLPESASNDLIGVLRDEKLRQRIWIGFQVIVEFLHNRHEAISDQKNKFSTVRNLLGEANEKYDEVFEKLTEELSKLKLKQRHSLIDPDKFITPEKIASGRAFLDDFARELSSLESKQADVNDRDQIKDTVIELFSGKIGDGFTRKELEELYKVGEKRYEQSIPPGYKDKSKQGSYIVEDTELVRKYGDLILWREIIRKARTDGISNIVLVTGDVKEDWWLEKRGKKLGPRKELLNEIYTEAKCVQNFYMYDTASFLKYAKSHLKASVQDSSITQAKNLIEKSRQSRVVAEEGYIYLPDSIRDVASRVPRLRVGIGRSVHSLPPVKFDRDAFARCLAEILSNAMIHGIQEYVGVQAKDRDEAVALRFKNRIASTIALPLPETEMPAGPARGGGLLDVEQVMLKEGIAMRTARTEKIFLVELLIPKSKLYRDASAAST
jgi:PIN like domain